MLQIDVSHATKVTISKFSLASYHDIMIELGVVECEAGGLA